MKTKLKSILIYSCSFLLMVNTSCEDFVTGISEFDPTQPRDASAGQVINSAEVGIIAFSEGDLARLAGIFTDQFTGVDRQYVSLNNYTTTSGDYDSQWDNIYATALKSLRIARSKAEEVNNLRAKGLTQILEAYLMGMTAAAFGDIPFTQAVNIQEFPNPAYESQTDVYAAVLAMLDDAIANIQSSPAGTAFDGDFFGGGDADWIARANTLKAKFLLHLGRYPESLAAAQQGISDPSQDILAPHGTSYNSDFNIYYSFLVYDRPGYMSAADALAPRLLDPNAALTRNNAKTDEGARFDYSFHTFEIYADGYEPNYFSVYDRWGAPDGYFGTNTSFPILTYRENQLILAETELRVNGFDNALDALNDYRAYLETGAYINPGYIAADNIQYDPYVAADFAPDAGVFNPAGMENPDNISAESALYREIIEEKYVSILGTLEVFNDMRRTGFGDFSGQQNWEIIGVTPNTGATIPQRFLIPQTEINSNTSTPTPPGLFEKTPVFN
jgi:hypothetical protein